jgi:hypothetical protein
VTERTAPPPALYAFLGVMAAKVVLSLSTVPRRARGAVLRAATRHHRLDYATALRRVRLGTAVGFVLAAVVGVLLLNGRRWPWLVEVVLLPVGALAVVLGLLHHNGVWPPALAVTVLVLDAVQFVLLLTPAVRQWCARRTPVETPPS